MENKTLPRGGGLLPTSGTGDNLDRPPNRSVEETTPTRPKVLMILHWLTVFCLFVLAVLILTRDQVSGRALRIGLLEGHRHFGLFVLALCLARLGLRMRLGKLSSGNSSSRLVQRLAASTHGALYALLLAQPLLGWALSSAQGKPVHLFGVSLPALLAADEDIADALQLWHQEVGWILLGLILLHVAAALWHHLVLRDDVLRMMLPSRRR